MSNPQSPYVVNDLTPTNQTGAPNQSYQLTRTSVSPVFRGARDARGIPTEETAPPGYWRPFLTRDGCINKVPLRTGAVFSMTAEAKAYEDETMTELISEGFVPAWLCPHSMKFQHLTGGGPFVPGGTDCGGTTKNDFEIVISGGCEHLQKEGATRRANVLAIYNAKAEADANAEAVRYANVTSNLAQGIVDGVSKVVALNHGSDRKAKLRDGRED